MSFDLNFGWTSTIGEVMLGATKADGGTRRVSYRIGGGTTLPFMESRADSPSPLIALEICDYLPFWSPIVKNYCGDLVNSVGEWAKAADASYGADLIRLVPDQHPAAKLLGYRNAWKNGRRRPVGIQPPARDRREQRAEDRQRGLPDVRRGGAGGAPPSRHRGSREGTGA